MIKVYFHQYRNGPSYTITVPADIADRLGLVARQTINRDTLRKIREAQSKGRER